MEKEKTSKVIAVAALIVAVIGLGIGFAAFNASLTIDAGATVEVQDTFSSNVKFVDSSLSCTPKADTTASVDTSTAAIADHAVSGIDVTLKTPGDAVTCTVDVKNASAFTAYLEEIKTASAISCPAVTNAQGVEEACATITLDVTSGDTTVQATSTAAAQSTAITGNTIAKDATSTVSFTITYAGPAVASETFTVSVPQISVKYSTVD